MKLLIALWALGATRARGLDSQVNPECSNSDKECHPEQVHIAFGEKTNAIRITWATMKDVQQSLVEYGERRLDMNATGEHLLFDDEGGCRQWIHNTLLQDLKFNTTYVYRVGSQFGWSQQFSFQTPPADEGWVVRAVIFGDMGVNNPVVRMVLHIPANCKSLPFLTEDVTNGHYDFVLHVGDFAYNLDNDKGTWGDTFMRSIEPFAAKVPYMVCPGNHEYYNNFTHYKNRFSMPGDSRGLFYSWDIGPIHFVSINTEVYYDDYGVTGSKEEILTQYHWLQNDLKEANKIENRKKHPWIILYGHRPMLCTSSTAGDGCRGAEYAHRVGIPRMGGYGLEVLLKEYAVDIAVWAHEHNYERMWPVYNKTVYNGSDHHPYTNPRAPVHLTSGSAGCSEHTDQFYHDPYAWSAFRSPDYGYTRLYAYNSSHIHIEQLSTQHVEPALKGGPETEHKPKKIDSFWVIKDHHQPYDI